jgi:hypothetical protein
MAPPLLRWAVARIDASAEETMRESMYGDDVTPSPQPAGTAGTAGTAGRPG